MRSFQRNYLYIGLIAYIIGLFCTGLFSFPQGFVFLVSILIVTTVLIVIILQWKPWGIYYTHCILLGLIIIGGFYYYHWRLPTADNLDISHQLSSRNFSSNNVIVEGKILTNPRINQSQRGKFIFQAQDLISQDGQQEKVTGRVYVTAPLLQVTGLYPSMIVRIRGRLYQPQNTLNPGGFNFAQYLSRDGIFTGLSAQSVDVISEGNLWSRNLSYFRQRIMASHVRYLKVPKGNLVSSMVIGSRAVDLDFDLKESFRLAGLAHILAASGFHVSILLGLLLYLTQFVTPFKRLLIICISLFIYSAIAGFYPSILRACLMGLAVVIGIVYDRSVKVYATLLLAAVILLLINPIWIWDLGFQLSFLATWSLIVCLPAIVTRLDWMPPTLANLIAVPLAATIWTLPLQCYVFHNLPLYGILTNIIATPFVLVITLGGFISAFFGLFFPLLGSAIAYILFVPIVALITIVEKSNNLPFSSLAVGEINIIQLIMIYLIFCLICINEKIRKYWLIITIATLISVIIPLTYQKINLVQVTLLKTRSAPIIIIQNQNKNTIINVGNKESARFNLIPFLRSQGINKLDLVVTDGGENKKSGLNLLKKFVKIAHINIPELDPLQPLNNKIKKENNIQLNLDNKKWLIVNHNNIDKKYHPDILVWSDRKINYQQIKKLNPETIIVNSKITDPNFLEYLSTHNIQLLSSYQNAIQWQPQKGFKIYNSGDFR